MFRPAHPSSSSGTGPTVPFPLAATRTSHSARRPHASDPITGGGTTRAQHVQAAPSAQTRQWSDEEVLLRRLIRSIVLVDPSDSRDNNSSSNDDLMENQLLSYARRIIHSSIGLRQSRGGTSSSLSLTRRSQRGGDHGQNFAIHEALHRIERQYRLYLMDMVQASGTTRQDEQEVYEEMDRLVWQTVEESQQAHERLQQLLQSVHHPNLALADSVLTFLSLLVGTRTQEDDVVVAVAAAAPAAVLPSAPPPPPEHAPTYDTEMMVHSASDVSLSLTAPESRTMQAHTTSLSRHHVHLALQQEEVLLLRECLLAMRGLEGDNFKFVDAANAVYQGLRIRPGSLGLAGGGAGAADAISICGEAGWLQSRVKSYISQVLGGTEVEDEEAAVVGGAVPRALASAMATELEQYESYLSDLEATLSLRNSSTPIVLDSAWAASSPEPPPHPHAIVPPLTLRQLLVLARPCIRRLTTLASVADSVRHLTGGPLLTALLRHAVHGDSRHVHVCQTSLLPRAARPWYDMLYEWTFWGSLPRPYYGARHFSHEDFAQEMEFFVTKQRTDDFLWNGRFVFHEERVPRGLLSVALARQAFVVGKGIHFIRLALNDAAWELQLPHDESTPSPTTTTTTTTTRSATATWKQLLQGGLFGPMEGTAGDGNVGGEPATPTLSQKALLGYGGGGSLPHGSTGTMAAPHNSSRPTPSVPLHRTMAEAAQQVHSHILDSLFGPPHYLATHFWGLKQFLFLGQGDFITALMEHLETREFTGGDSQAPLWSALESALRCTNARFLPTLVLERVGIVWQDPFDAAGAAASASTALTTPVHAAAEQQQDEAGTTTPTAATAPPASAPASHSWWDGLSLTYRVETPLTAVLHPRAMNQYQMVFGLLFRLKQCEVSLNATWRHAASLEHALRTSGKSAEAHGFLRRIAITRQSMSHFLSNLQSFFLLEVLETGWKQLQQCVVRTLDDVIGAHNDYLQDVLTKCCLLDPLLHNAIAKCCDKCLELGRLPFWDQALQWVDQWQRRQERQGRQQGRPRQAPPPPLPLARNRSRAKLLRSSSDHSSSRSEYSGGGGATTAVATTGSDLQDILMQGETRTKLERVATDFDAALRALLQQMHVQLNQDGSLTHKFSPQQQRRQGQHQDYLRYLAFRLDFNNFYGRVDQVEQGA